MKDQCSAGMLGNSIFRTPAITMSGYRCIQVGMGSACRDPQDSRPFFPDTAVAPHQRQGAESNSPGVPNIPSVSHDRQHTAVLYINSQGEVCSSSLCQEALKLWDFCIAYYMNLEASYLPGSKNILADILSRTCHNHEWSIHLDILTTSSSSGEFPSRSVHGSSSRPNSTGSVSSSVSSSATALGSITGAFLLPWNHHLLCFPRSCLCIRSYSRSEGRGHPSY